jgi:hypothetical protein
MKVEDKLLRYKEITVPSAREEAIKQTIDASKSIIKMKEQVVPYYEFLFTQLKLVQKRWWTFQLLILILLWRIIPLFAETDSIQRILGVSASLFIILAVPELWKNRNYKSIEIEATCYYSLRQIYAARMTLFGIVDVLLITLFCGISSTSFNLSMEELFVQFLFPMTITACICFAILCNKYRFNEFIAIGMCIIWNVLWLLFIQNETAYSLITMQVWIGLFVAALAFLLFTIYKTLAECNYYEEVKVKWN